VQGSREGHLFRACSSSTGATQGCGCWNQYSYSHQWGRHPRALLVQPRVSHWTQNQTDPPLFSRFSLPSSLSLPAPPKVA
jgi:hypothetical protein